MKIQIKRSNLSSNAPANTLFGELSYTANGQTVYINNSSESVSILSQRTPGALSSNQTLIANSSSYINQTSATNTEVRRIYANNSLGQDSQVLMSGGIGNVYWGTLDILYDTLYRNINIFVPYKSEQNEFILNYKAERELTLLENFANSVAYIETPTTSTQSFNIYKNSTQIGAISFNTGNNYGSFSLVAQTVFLEETDVLKIKQTTINDNSLENYSINLKFIKRAGNNYIPEFPAPFYPLEFETFTLTLGSNTIGFPQ